MGTPSAIPLEHLETNGVISDLSRGTDSGVWAVCSFPDSSEGRPQDPARLKAGLKPLPLRPAKRRRSALGAGGKGTEPAAARSLAAAAKGQPHASPAAQKRVRARATAAEEGQAAAREAAAGTVQGCQIGRQGAPDWSAGAA